jgi:hypothetical protein
MLPQRIYPMVHAAVTLDAYLPKEVLTYAISLFLSNCPRKSHQLVVFLSQLQQQLINY